VLDSKVRKELESSNVEASTVRDESLVLKWKGSLYIFLVCYYICSIRNLDEF